MESNNALTEKNNLELEQLQSPNELKKVFQYVADMTNEAKKAAEDNPYTSTGTLKSSLKGAPTITSALRAEGEEAHKRGIVSAPTMQGGLDNQKIHDTAVAGLKTIELLESQKTAIPAPKDDDSITLEIVDSDSK